ncbi:MAG: transposase [Pseudomonadota bacterium]|nr:transposase [Pseudomonadota bacterium]
MEERIKFHAGLDVHKDSISVALAEAGREPGRLIGNVAHDVNKLLKILAKIGTAEQLHIVFEAGPTGFGLQRALKARGYVCEVIASSQIPQRPGDRVKTDGRDSVQLAECSRAGQLSAVWIPDPDDEAIRHLSRAREDAVNSRVQVRHQLKGFLLRHDVRYTGKTSWCEEYYRWLSTLNFGAGAAQTAFAEYWQAVKSIPSDWRYLGLVAPWSIALRTISSVSGRIGGPPFHASCGTQGWAADPARKRCSHSVACRPRAML